MNGNTEMLVNCWLIAKCPELGCQVRPNKPRTSCLPGLFQARNPRATSLPFAPQEKPSLSPSPWSLLWKWGNKYPSVFFCFVVVAGREVKHRRHGQAPQQVSWHFPFHALWGGLSLIFFMNSLSFHVTLKSVDRANPQVSFFLAHSDFSSVTWFKAFCCYFVVGTFLNVHLILYVCVHMCLCGNQKTAYRNRLSSATRGLIGALNSGPQSWQWHCPAKPSCQLPLQILVIIFYFYRWKEN